MLTNLIKWVPPGPADGGDLYGTTHLLNHRDLSSWSASSMAQSRLKITCIRAIDPNAFLFTGIFNGGFNLSRSPLRWFRFEQQRLFVVRNSVHSCHNLDTRQQKQTQNYWTFARYRVSFRAANPNLYIHTMPV